MADLGCGHCGSELHASSRCPYVTDIPLNARAVLGDRVSDDENPRGVLQHVRATPRKHCVVCWETFPDYYPGQKYCSKRCSEKAARRRQGERRRGEPLQGHVENKK